MLRVDTNNHLRMIFISLIGGGGLLKGNTIAVCFQSHFSGTEIYTAVRVDTSHHRSMIFISTMGGGPAELSAPKVTFWVAKGIR